MEFPLDIPGPVKNLNVADTADGEVSLVWEEPENDGGSKIIGYVVERRDVKRKTWTLATDRADTTEYTVTGLQKDSKYFFRVCARNRLGSGPTVETDKPVQAKNKFGRYLIHSPYVIYICFYRLKKNFFEMNNVFVCTSRCS